jgi:hypothetical protein
VSNQNLPDLQADEALARFVMFRDWVRADGTVRPDAFIPPKDLNFSVTRHIGLSQTELWQIGEEVAHGRGHNLLGRADFQTRSVSAVGLSLRSAALPRNPNHAHITGWPSDKPSQKILAEQLAASSQYVQRP